ncbi:MAG TPA: hypothetical protein VJY34_01690 [Roseiarcus sp.]|nr:hypothetical protein [Roseiarcus sp.]
MSDRLVVSTRKGLFWVERGNGDWRVAHVDFLGDNVSIALHDLRTGYDYAALNHGHFGVKLHRRENGVWTEIAAPAYPPKPEGLVDRDGWGKDIPYSLINIFSLETGGPDEDGLLWCGTIPGGLFRSRDHGATWELIRSLWDNPKRQQWMGGGTDWPAIHSICIDPRDSAIVRIGVSCGGVWETRDGGNAWECRAHGMFAAFLPPELGRDPNVQDPHRLAQSRSAPDRLWAQHHNGIFRSDDASASWREIADVRPSSSASPSPSIRASRTRPGSCRQSRTSAAFPSRESSSSPAHATPARRSTFSARGCRRSTPMTSSIATRWTSTRAATGSPSPPRPADSTSAKTRATAGGRSPTDCRRRMRSGSFPDPTFRRPAHVVALCAFM